MKQSFLILILMFFVQTVLAQITEVHIMDWQGTECVSNSRVLSCVIPGEGLYDAIPAAEKYVPTSRYLIFGYVDLNTDKITCRNDHFICSGFYSRKYNGFACVVNATVGIKRVLKMNGSI